MRCAWAHGHVCGRVGVSVGARGRGLHDGVGVDGRGVVAQRLPDVAADVGVGDEVEEEEALEALERDGAQRGQPQQQRREPALLRAVRPPAVLVQAREHLIIIST